ncbi:MAG: MFS transporter [Propionicimonas sp.]|uniref:MFS transporter n=1 Tax=Propionicimonas sp. TaxID=1955623 RepID=UPI002B214BD1|nr:MFS transporter [Propionicimonas sp.]MEA4945875.1 MFS transporter [Propionicimonas sp.]
MNDTTGGVRARGNWVALVAVVLISANLRPGTMVGPVLAELLRDLGQNEAWGGLLTAMPGICFAAFGALSVAFATRVGLAPALFWGMVATAVGLAVRSWTSDAWVFLALTALALGGMALGNVLLPAFIKRRFPNRVPLLMALYGSFLAVGATLGSMLAVPLAEVLPGGWRGSLAVWGPVAALAAVPILVVIVREGSGRLGAHQHERGPSLLRSRRAVALGIFFGVQSMHAYTQFGWTAQMFRDGGVDRDAAGLLVSLLASLGIVTGLVMPMVVERVHDLRAVVAVLVALLVAGYLGILYAPTVASWLWAVCLGLSGAAFPMALALITARTRDHHLTARLSGFCQTVGYALAACGPLLVGVLRTHSSGWTVPLWVLIVSSAVMLVAGLIACTPGYVDDDLAASEVKAG